MTTLLNNQALSNAAMVQTNAPAPVLAGVAEEEYCIALRDRIRLKKFLVAVDFSSGSLQTLNYAAALANRLGSAVSLVHVVEPESLMSGLRDVPLVVDEGAAEQRAKERLEQWIQHKIRPAMQGESLVRRGTLVRQIVETARGTDADLIVLGRAHRRGWERLLVPSRLKRIVRQAPCPMLIVPESFLAHRCGVAADAAAGPGRSVLVPVDGSERSRWALKWGASLVDPTRGSLSVFYVPNLYETAIGDGVGRSDQLHAHTIEALEERLWAWARETTGADPGVNIVRGAGVRDAELLALTAVREHCDLIVLYSHSGSLRQRLMAGRLADELAGMASCPVLCLPEVDADRIAPPAKVSWWTRLMQAHLEVPREDDRD